MMIEFFPRGDLTSYDGFCAVKVRVPDKTRLRWSFALGEIWSGPRCDLYERHLWWCRSGVVWNNFCTEYDLERQIDENDSVTAVLELHPMADDWLQQEPVEMGRDPFCHAANREILPAVKPSTGERLLNPKYRESTPARASTPELGYVLGEVETWVPGAKFPRGYRTHLAKSAGSLWDSFREREKAGQLPPVRRPATRAGISR